MDGPPKRWHIYPTNGREHDTSKAGSCWCAPSFLKFCSNCDGHKGMACFFCSGDGYVKTDLEFEAVIVVHNAIRELVK